MSEVELQNIITNIINIENGKASFKSISKKIDMDRYKLESILEKLKLDGKILQLGNKYMPFPSDLMMGEVVASLTGNKYIISNSEKIPLSSDFFDNVNIGDIVTFRLADKGTASLVSIVTRDRKNKTCEVILDENNKLKLRPFNSKSLITLDKESMKDLYVGDIVLVETIPETDFEGVKYNFIKKLGRTTDPGIADTAIAANFGFDNEYDSEYMKEVYSLPTDVKKEEIIGRADYRGQRSFTIDGSYTKDMDDGVYGEMLPNGNIRVYVHIADVSHYIKMGSKIFERACEKTSSLYMNNTVFHMLHYIISTGICSLNPDKDRLTKTVTMEIDPKGNIVNYNIEKSVIRSRKKMVYEEVDKIINDDNPSPDYVPFKKDLLVLYDAAMRLENKFTTVNGKTDFASNEQAKTYNFDGSIDTTEDIDDSISRKIIENLMIAANTTVATYLLNLGLPAVFRNHRSPKKEKLNDLIYHLNKQGYHIRKITDNPTPKVIQKILNYLSKFSEYPILSQLFVMEMERAEYDTVNEGHFALGLDAYCHFTSPIRRIADLLVHMVLDIILAEPEKFNNEYLTMLEAKFKQIAKRATRMERYAECAELQDERRLMLQKLEKNKDVPYEATIIEVGKQFKIRVEGVDTYIDSHDLDYTFTFDRKRKIYYDKPTNTIIKLGTKIEVKINKVSSTDDRFSVKVLGLGKSEGFKKKVLIKG